MKAYGNEKQKKSFQEATWPQNGRSSFHIEETASEKAMRKEQLGEVQGACGRVQGKWKGVGSESGRAL